MPDGTIIKNVPKGTTKEQLALKLQSLSASPEAPIANGQAGVTR